MDIVPFYVPCLACWALFGLLKPAMCNRTLHYVPTCMSFHKIIVVITRRAYYFHDCINIYIWYSSLKDLWSCYRKLARVGFKPTTTEFHSDALTDWAMRLWVQLALRANFVQLFQFHCLFSVRLHFRYCLRQWPHLFQSMLITWV